MPRFNPVTSTNPRLIEAYLRKKALQFFGNETEDQIKITARNGRYKIEMNSDPFPFSLGPFRKSEIPEIVRDMRFIAGSRG